MNKNLKYFILSMIMLTIQEQSVVAYDAIHEKNMHNEVTTTSPDYTFKMDFTMLFLKAAGDSDYACEAYFLPALSPHWETFDLTTNHNFAFDLGFQTIFHGSDTIGMANWEHLRSSTTAAQNVAVAGDMIGAFSFVGPDDKYFTRATASTSFSFDQFNARYGQMLQIGNKLNANIFAGLNFSRIHQTMIRTYHGIADSTDTFTVPDNTPFTRTMITPTTFSGTGPEFGCDFNFNIHKGLQFVGQATVGLLAGSIKNHTEFITQGAATTALLVTGEQSPTNLNAQQIIVPNIVAIVPEFSQRIGMAFEHEFRNHCAAHFEIGYQAQLFMNALQSVDMASEIDFTAESQAPAVAMVGVFVKTMKREVHNFSVSGPYFKINMSF